MINGFPPVRKRRRLRRIYKFLKYFGLTIVALCLILLILFSAQILSLREFYRQGISGQANLEQAIISAEQDEFGQAMVLAKAAEDNFTSLTGELSQIKNNRLAGYFPFIMDQFNGLEGLLVANRFLSRAVYDGASFGKNLANLITGDKKLNFSQFSPAERRQVLAKIFESTPELNGIKADLALAYIGLDQINTANVFFPLKEKIIQTKKNINEASQTLEKTVSLSQLLPVLAGYPSPTNFLVVLQDNNELRPTGGILDTYGILQFKDGDIASFKTRDTYSLDTPVKDKVKVVPPEPIKKYLADPPANGWSLRDANWSPDWPTAAQKIDWFYKKESGLNPAAEKISESNGVIALTPKLITDFLRIAGPVSVQGQTYDQTNFQALLKPLEKNVFSWPRKEIIGEIIKELKNKIFSWPTKDWPKAVNLLADNLATKDLLFYLTDKQLENIALANGWGGEIKSTVGDYLMVVDANLSNARIDALLNRGLEYKVEQGANGLFSKLTLNYAYRGAADQGVGIYKSYTRVYAPLGSQLTKVSGYELNKIEVGNELGKTWFGFYFEVEPGKIKNLTLEYKLPVLASAPKQYELYLQKQPGKEINYAKVDLSFLNDIKSYSPTSLYMLKPSPDKISWEGDLNLDRSFEVRF